MSTKTDAKAAPLPKSEDRAFPIPLTLRTLGIVLVLVAIGISGYMSYTQLNPSVDIVCTKGNTFNCQTVEQSSYSKLFGIPLALLGLFTNLGILGLFVLEDRLAILEQFGISLQFLVVLFATVFSVYLIYLQAEIIGSWCQWCLAHEIAIFALFGVTVLRLRNLMATLGEDD